MRFFAAVCVLALFAFISGCSSNSQVTGKVIFDDGTPLTTGEVRFESSGYLGSGQIQSDGTYTVGSKAEKDGIPKGSYQVSIYAFEYPAGKPGENPAKTPPPKSLVAKEFQSGKTSGLVCEVNGKTTFDITVKKPKK